MQGHVGSLLELLQVPEDKQEPHRVHDFATGDKALDSLPHPEVPAFDQVNDDAKWIGQHRQFCEANSMTWPVQTSPYILPADTLRVVFPLVSRLPYREVDWVVVCDECLCCHGTGIAAFNGKRIFGDVGQALPRTKMNFDSLPCILPNAKIVDFEKCELISGPYLLRIQGVVPSLDFSIDYGSIGHKLACDMAGNAMNGWCIGCTTVVQMTTSVAKPRYRIRRSLSFSASTKRSKSSEELDSPAGSAWKKRHTADSGLGVLLSLS